MSTHFIGVELGPALFGIEVSTEEPVLMVLGETTALPAAAGGAGPGGGTGDHRDLTHRFDDDQHDIDSITDLRAELDTMIADIAAAGSGAGLYAGTFQHMGA